MEQLPTIDIANDSMNKGLVRENKELIAWDCIQECDPDGCPIGHKCQYAVTDGSKCSVQVEYLQALTNTVFRTYKYLNDDILFKLGMHLVPLYSQLCRQKIVEKSIGRLAYEDAKGKTHIHPIYREIRETMKTIMLAWREFGFVVPPNMKDPLSDGAPYAGKTGFGDPNHYASISQSDTKRNVIR